MLVDSDAIATIAVKDLKVARHFYGEKLGLKERPDSDNPGVVTYQSGGSKVLLYQSQYAGTNRATIATWAAQDLEAVVRTLAGKGVTFEHSIYPNSRERETSIRRVTSKSCGSKTPTATS